jgi:hypothetical protein
MPTCTGPCGAVIRDSASRASSARAASLDSMHSAAPEPVISTACASTLSSLSIGNRKRWNTPIRPIRASRTIRAASDVDRSAAESAVRGKTLCRNCRPVGSRKPQSHQFARRRSPRNPTIRRSVIIFVDGRRHWTLIS